MTVRGAGRFLALSPAGWLDGCVERVAAWSVGRAGFWPLAPPAMSTHADCQNHDARNEPQNQCQRPRAAPPPLGGSLGALASEGGRIQIGAMGGMCGVVLIFGPWNVHPPGHVHHHRKPDAACAGGCLLAAVDALDAAPPPRVPLGGCCIWTPTPRPSHGFAFPRPAPDSAGAAALGCHLLTPATASPCFAPPPTSRGLRQRDRPQPARALAGVACWGSGHGGAFASMTPQNDAPM